MLPPHRAMRAGHPLEGGRVDLGRQQRHQMAPRRPRRIVRLDAAARRPPPPRRRRSARASSGAHRLHLGGHHVGLHAEQQPAVHPDLLDVVRPRRRARPARRTAAPRCPGRPARSPSRGYGDAASGHDRRRVLLGRPSRLPPPSACTMRAGTPATTQRSGTSPRTTAPAATTTCSPICAPGRITALAPSQLPEPMRTGASVGHWRPIGLDRVLVGVVLVRDVDVGPGLDVVADDDLPVAHDVRAPADQAAAADGDDRVGRHLLARRHAGRDGGTRADDGLGPDVDQVLVVDGALGEQQAGPGPIRPKRRPRGSSGPIAPEIGGTLPGRVHEPGQRPPQRSRGGSGPSSRRNGRWCRTGGRHGRPPVAQRGPRGYSSRLCSPSHRTAAPTPRRSRRTAVPSTAGQFLQLSALGAAGLRRRGRLATTDTGHTQRPPARARRQAPRAARRGGHRACRAASSCPRRPG